MIMEYLVHVYMFNLWNWSLSENETQSVTSVASKLAVTLDCHSKQVPQGFLCLLFCCSPWRLCVPCSDFCSIAGGLSFWRACFYYVLFTSHDFSHMICTASFAKETVAMPYSVPLMFKMKPVCHSLWDNCFLHSFFQKEVTGLEMMLSGRAYAEGVRGPGFHLQHSSKQNYKPSSVACSVWSGFPWMRATVKGRHEHESGMLASMCPGPGTFPYMA